MSRSLKDILTDADACMTKLISTFQEAFGMVLNQGAQMQRVLMSWWTESTGICERAPTLLHASIFSCWLLETLAPSLLAAMKEHSLLYVLDVSPPHRPTRTEPKEASAAMIGNSHCL